MKLGVITDGISMDLEQALKVMSEHGMQWAELQFVWDKEIGDHTPEELTKMKGLLAKYNMNVTCITRHNFVGLCMKTTTADDDAYKQHMEALKRCIRTAKELGTDTVRVMSGRKEMIIFGTNGAEKWVASTGSWDNLVKLMKVPVRLAEEEGITLAAETGNNAMVTSGYLARKLVDDIGSKNFKIIWDIPNTLYCTDVPYPDGYEQVKDHLSHIHVKDMKYNIAKAEVQFCKLGDGAMAPYLEDIGKALKRDEFQGVVSYESVYRPDGGTFEDGFRESFDTFKKLFG